MRAALLLSLAVLLPNSCLAGLGLGGLAPVPGVAAAAVVTDIAVPTDLCVKEFCLAAVPAACAGRCILTPFGTVTEYCSTACIAVWDSTTVKGCLATAATGSYIQSKLTAISNTCNAGAIAAAKKKATLAKYQKLFPCTATVKNTTVLALASCLTGTQATAVNCPAACATALADIPTACRSTFPTLSAPWKSTLASCIATTAAAPGPAMAVSPGAPAEAAGTTPTAPGLLLAPASGTRAAATPTSSALRALPTRTAAAALFVSLAVVVVAA